MVTVGKKVKNFSAESTSGKVGLSDFKGTNLLLYFYPKDNTPGCTQESQDFRNHYEHIKATGTEVIGISRDSLASHEKFIEKYNLPFPLISDPEESLCQQFDVIKLKNMYGKKILGIERSTFLIDGEGILVQEWRKVKVKEHIDQVLTALENMKESS